MPRIDYRITITITFYLAILAESADGHF
jgi:hypothetical protein